MMLGQECIPEPLGIVSTFDRKRAAWFMLSLSARARESATPVGFSIPTSEKG